MSFFGNALEKNVIQCRTWYISASSSI